MACGTPVIGWRNGSIPELIADEVTGFVGDDIEAAIHAVGRVADLDRRACREVFKERFDLARMTSSYVRIYRQLVYE
jgi:glycosyltransferase involved in cell wall biosynthesis